MKAALMAIFAIAVVVFASGAVPVMAKKEKPDCPEGVVWEGWGGGCVYERYTEDRNPNQADNERGVADSGNEDSASAAFAGNR